MPIPDPHLATAALDYLKDHRGNSTRPYYLAIDGRSGSGKSTLAAQLTTALRSDGVTVIEGDTFYKGGSAELWDGRTPAQNADNTINHSALKQVIESLQNNQAGSWYAFDWHSTSWNTDSPAFETTPRTAQQTSWVIVEGVYTAHPVLASLFHCRLLLDCCAQLSTQRTTAREAGDYCPQWAQRWTDAESWYFSTCAPASHFDLVLSLTQTHTSKP